MYAHQFAKVTHRSAKMELREYRKMTQQASSATSPRVMSNSHIFLALYIPKQNKQALIGAPNTTCNNYPWR